MSQARVCFCFIVFGALVLAPAAFGVSDRTVDRHEVLARSTEGRPIQVVELGDPDESRKILIVGCIHGDEPAGIAIARALARISPPTNVDLWIVDDLNPDGVNAGTRVNARGVDLNRNFPFRWRPLGHRGTPHYSGPHPLSERESQFAAHLIRRLRPAVTIWFHQALDVVDDSVGNVALERRFAREVGMRVKPLRSYPGSAVSWESHIFPGSTPFVVELHAGALSPAEIERFVHAVRALGSPGSAPARYWRHVASRGDRRRTLAFDGAT
jgi:protein MpaA